MCGICGLIHTNAQEPVAQPVLDAMCGSIYHRGPDSAGTFCKEQVGLGIRRLSIIDLEGGDQPIHNEDQTLWIVFNGEIYNYPDLTSMLKHRGHRFYTQTDTEVIVHAYEELGDEFIHHLNGMFAFALWDSRRQRLLLARDRMGIKPLYYTKVGSTLVFGSELKAILAHPGIERKINLVALNEYLSFEYIPTPLTIFHNIFKLPPGHLLEFVDGDIEIKKYWDLSLARSENVQPHRIEEYETQLLEVLRDVVHKELISDVPVGILLSGGLDSSTVASIATEFVPDIKTFSITMEDSSFDESKHAWLVAKHLNTRHYELTLTPDHAIDLLPDIGQALDEPIGDSSIIPTLLVSQFARQYVKVALGGDGGDEMFSGYTTFQAHRLVEYYERFVPGMVRWHLVPWITENLPISYDNISVDFKLKKFISGGGVPAVVRHHRWLGSFTPNQKKRLIKPWAQIREKDTYDIAFSHLQTCDARELINQLLYCDVKLYLEGDILFKVDRASMANSLETRVPLLNHTLVEYMAGVPHQFKLKGLTTKYLLRRAMRNRLPKQIVQRSKKGFNFPVAKWLAGPLLPFARELLSEERLRQQGLFEPSYVQGLLSEHLDRRRDNRKLLWTLIAFQIWYENWA
jgi:asparagine synthase (glutamine-hydrolysing)